MSLNITFAKSSLFVLYFNFFPVGYPNVFFLPQSTTLRSLASHIPDILGHSRATMDILIDGNVGVVVFQRYVIFPLAIFTLPYFLFL